MHSMNSADTAAAAVAKLLPGIDGHELSAIAQAFEILGISASEGLPSSDSKLSIVLGNTTHQNGSTHAEFNLACRQWTLKQPSSSSKSGTGYDPQSQTHTQSHKQNSIEAGQCLKRNPTEEQEVEGDGEDWMLQITPTEHNKFLLTRNWANTSLGPTRQWPLILRLMTLKMLADPRPANLYWGEDRVCIYKEPFAVIACSRHPFMMAARAADALPATWPYLGPMMQEVQQSGKAFSMSEFELEVNKKNGFLEEAWYDGVYLPIRDSHGNFVGIHNSVSETTESVLVRRYGRLIPQIATVPDLDSVTSWQHVVRQCESFERDVPLLVAYSADTKETTGSNRCVFRLEGSLGVPQNHKAIPDTIDLEKTNAYLAPAFKMSKAQGRPVLLDMPNGDLPEFLEGMGWRGWKCPSTHVVVMPILITGLIAGFFVMGLNPRRPYDHDLKQLVFDFHRTSTSTVASSITYEQAREWEKLLTKELTEKERFTRKMAEVATVGIYSMSEAGFLKYANSRYHDIVGNSSHRQIDQAIDFRRYIHEDDLLKVVEAHEECKSQRRNVSINVRLKRKWTPPGSSAEEYVWVLNSITPDEEGGKAHGVIGCLTDIGHTMWALQLQQESTEAALESKRQLKRFVDMTSHEMRNPLGAITQCADDIFQSVEDGKELYGGNDNFNDWLESIRENAKTILFCSAHQRTIADDILMVSKLDSSLLSIASALNQPFMIAKEVIQMFEAETSNSKIDLKLTLDKTYDITYAFCDASRLRQILINLLTNAIKFTKGRKKREIRIVMGTCTKAPPPHMSELEWYLKDAPPLADLVNENEVFLTFEVQDTGKGMTQQEMSQLFNRFAQASPTTSASYGGSGLGLFISMQLSELQGGRIGLSSVPDEGSNFGFYIKVQRSEESENQDIRRISESLKKHKLTTANSSQLDILLVEDNAVNQRVLSKQLQKAGHRVHVANHGLEALEFLRTTRYWKGKIGPGEQLDVILMDWEMPVMNGLDCTEEIRKLEREGLITEHLPVIITSANTREEQMEQAFAVGIDKFLAKPFTVAQLLALIHSDN